MKIKFAPVAIAALLTVNTAVAADLQTFEISIKDHKFVPDQVTIPADTKVKLVINNLDPTVEEFESYDLNREKIVSGNSAITVFVGPLDPGSYAFFGEFHEDTAQGTLIAE